MFSLPVRRIITFIGTFVTMAIAIGGPLGFGVITYLNEAEALSRQADLNAAYVSKHAYQSGPMWSFETARLQELVEANKVRSTTNQHRILTTEGKVVLDDAPALAHPVMVRSAPIIFHGKVVGTVEVFTSMARTVTATCLVAILSIALGFAAYYPVKVLPIKLLDETVDELEAKADAALNNMAQGLCMWDAQERLVICNSRYHELYGFSPDVVRPRASLRDVIEHSCALGNHPGETVNDVLAERRAHFSGCAGGAVFWQLKGDRTIAITDSRTDSGGWVSTYQDITDRRKSEEKIAHMVHHDTLTGLPNRVLFREQLDEAVRLAEKGDKFAVLCLDLDHFKAVNDTLGHPLGDALLQAVSSRLQTCARETDTVARLGGDEFAVIVTIQEPHDAIPFSARLIEVISAPYELDGHQVVVGTSVGIAIAPNDACEPDQLLKAADMALYRAKVDGRGIFRFFEPEMDTMMQVRRALEIDLRKAVVSSEFEVYYQPLVNLQNNSVSGFEALVRWNHPTRGLVPPAEFIPLAEEIGLINKIGGWVLKQACIDAATWPREVKVAVNLSPVQFKNRALVLDVISALGESGLSAKRLELEITETIMLQDTEGTLTTLHQLRELGVSISMDDFGTGYSSLSYLRKFPFDKIKIDQSFIRDLDNSLAIVRAVTGLSVGLGMSTTAEGVETQAQLDQLRKEGCTEVQGYFFSRPQPASEVAGMLISVQDKSRAA